MIPEEGRFLVDADYQILSICSTRVMHLVWCDSHLKQSADDRNSHVRTPTRLWSEDHFRLWFLDFQTIAYDGSRRTSFQSPPSMGGRSRANGMPNFLARDWCRSAKRSPGSLASVALQKSASGSAAISTSSVSRALSRRRRLGSRRA
jgi:hypothetical protein